MPKKLLQGRVISTKMNKTVVVEVEALKEFSKYRRKYKFHKKYKAHDEEEKCRKGDKVTIEETRPYSREKRWRVIKIEPMKEVEGEEENIEEVIEDEIRKGEALGQSPMGGAEQDRPSEAVSDEESELTKEEEFQENNNQEL